MLLWQGTCIVHEQFNEKEVVKLQNQHPNAKTIAHPECPEVLLNYADHVGSTRSLLNYTIEHGKKDGAEFIVLTEAGIIHQMQKHSPDAKFHAVSGLGQSGCEMCNNCPYMKLNTIEKLHQCMLNKTPEITLDDDLRLRAKASLDKMLEMSK